MSASTSRVATLRALARAAQTNHTINMSHVDHELQEIDRLRKVSPERRKNLLLVFHGMRALESALKQVIGASGVTPKNSLGGVLRQFALLPNTHPAYLSGNALHRFLTKVKDPRNRIMHQANAFPTANSDAEAIFGEVSACFSLLVRA